MTEPAPITEDLIIARLRGGIPVDTLVQLTEALKATYGPGLVFVADGNRTWISVAQPDPNDRR